MHFLLENYCKQSYKNRIKKNLNNLLKVRPDQIPTPTYYILQYNTQCF